jgi:hypothetical protein
MVISYVTISARFTSKDVSLLREVCRARGEDVSDFVRRSVKKELAGFGFYDDRVRQALGVDPLDQPGV